jgi:hypothetical protein
VKNKVPTPNVGASDALLLHEYGPNQSGGRLFRYNGHQVELDESISLTSDRAFQGYLVPYWESLAKRRTAIVFARDRKLYLDLSSGAVELLPEAAVVRHRLIGRTITVHTSAGLKEIKVFTPAWRHLTHDGMFPEDVEPIVHLMRELTDENSRERFIFLLGNGGWPEANTSQERTRER